VSGTHARPWYAAHRCNTPSDGTALPLLIVGNLGKRAHRYAILKHIKATLDAHSERLLQRRPKAKVTLGTLTQLRNACVIFLSESDGVLWHLSSPLL
jgi:hypothetical protein